MPHSKKKVWNVKVSTRFAYSEVWHPRAVRIDAHIRVHVLVLYLLVLVIVQVSVLYSDQSSSVVSSSKFLLPNSRIHLTVSGAY
jgi:hypothetical protein